MLLLLLTAREGMRALTLDGPEPIRRLLRRHRRRGIPVCAPAVDAGGPNGVKTGEMLLF